MDNKKKVKIIPSKQINLNVKEGVKAQLFEDTKRILEKLSTIDKLDIPLITKYYHQVLDLLKKIEIDESEISKLENKKKFTLTEMNKLAIHLLKIVQDKESAQENVFNASNLGIENEYTNSENEKEREVERIQKQKEKEEKKRKKEEEALVKLFTRAYGIPKKQKHLGIAYTPKKKTPKKGRKTRKN